jgi:hypothetical protein
LEEQYEETFFLSTSKGKITLGSRRKRLDALSAFSYGSK